MAAGEVEFEQDGSTVSGGPGFVAHFDPKERHEVRAVSDARLLLFLAPWPARATLATAPLASWRLEMRPLGGQSQRVAALGCVRGRFALHGAVLNQ